ncbi:MAG: hypothetical protein ABIK43_04245 [candidate division WOR-3 bacterium]
MARTAGTEESAPEREGDRQRAAGCDGKEGVLTMSAQDWRSDRVGACVMAAGKLIGAGSDDDSEIEAQRTCDREAIGGTVLPTVPYQRLTGGNRLLLVQLQTMC